MLPNLILSYSSRRGVCKLLAALAGTGALAVAVIEKVTSISNWLWMAAPLGLLWLIDVGYAAAQRRCADALKKNPGKDDPALSLWEGGDAGIARFFRELISLSIWAFYLIFFGLMVAGGEVITKANQEAAAAAAKVAQAAPKPTSRLGLAPRSSNLSSGPTRTNSGPMPFNPANPGVQRFTPPPFPTPSRFTLPTRSPGTPAGATKPAASLASSPAPAVKNP